MKEAAGEANVTVITIVLIGVVAAAGALLIPRIVRNMRAQSCCMEGGGTIENGQCRWVDGRLIDFGAIGSLCND